MAVQNESKEDVLLTPEQVHFGDAPTILAKRQITLVCEKCGSGQVREDVKYALIAFDRNKLPAKQKTIHLANFARWMVASRPSSDLEVIDLEVI